MTPNLLLIEGLLRVAKAAITEIEKWLKSQDKTKAM
jgi:hypothetical protein